MGFFDDAEFFLDIVKWLILLYMAYYLYNWARDKLVFSPTLTFIVAAVLIYFLVIEHPFIGALGIFGWILLTSGLIYIVGMFAPGVYAFIHRR